jgi:hypothetical protein
MNLRDVRPKLSALLAPQADDEPHVVDAAVDAVSPPVFMVAWGQPWLERLDAGGCNYRARALVLVVAGRLDSDEVIDRVEDMVATCLARIAADSTSWPLETVGVPERIAFGAIEYAAARLTYTPIVSI